MPTFPVKPSALTRQRAAANLQMVNNKRPTRKAAEDAVAGIRKQVLTCHVMAFNLIFLCVDYAIKSLLSPSSLKLYFKYTHYEVIPLVY